MNPGVIRASPAADTGHEATAHSRRRTHKVEFTKSTQNATKLETDKILCRDVLVGLRGLPDACVDCVLTSPPYWAHRDYGVRSTSWSDGTHVILGLEASVDAYVEHVREVFRELCRVLKPTGTLWIVLGDTYAGHWKGPGRSSNRSGVLHRGVPNKSLCLVPERIALGLAEDGWILRNRIVWQKPNHMPSSVKDRFTNSWEHLLFFVRQDRYRFDLDAVRVPHVKTRCFKTKSHGKVMNRPTPHLRGHRRPPHPGEPQSFHPLGKNPGDVWQISTQPSRSGHPAPYPERLCEWALKAGCPPGGLVLDPFVGSGTTALVAAKLGRRYIGFDANLSYVRTARTRLRRLKLTQQLKGGSP